MTNSFNQYTENDEDYLNIAYMQENVSEKDIIILCHIHTIKVKQYTRALLEHTH